MTHDVPIRPFRFGALSLGARPPTTWGAFARQLQDLGFSTLHVPHHFAMGLPPPMLALARAAEATETLHLGTLVMDNELQHPATLARDATYLADVSKCRFELGIGAGWSAEDHTWSGHEMSPASERIDRLEEAVQVLRRCWTDEVASFEGSHYRLVRLSSGSATAAPPPLLIGGGGRRVLGIAARWADIVSIAPTMASGRLGRASARTANRVAFEAKIAVVREAASARFRDLELHTTVTGVFGPDDEAANRAADAYGVTRQQLRAIPGVMIGTTDDMVEQLLDVRAATGISYVTIPEGAIDRVTPVVSRLAGR